MKNVSRWIPLIIITATLAGCVGTAETVEVTERAEPPADTMEVPRPAPEPAVSSLDTVEAQRFDQGKMWTFDNPPLDYFATAYSFTPDDEWFEHARLGALRFSTYCSASFVSPHGLVATNHHCARESITEVAREGEDLMEEGFYASSLEAEREVDDLYVEQLISIEEVTDTVMAEVAEIEDANQRQRALGRIVSNIQEEMTADVRQRDSLLRVEVVELYAGGQYSAYTFRRYEDVRLVMAPELQVAYFGGDPDNFTYPRFALDFSFFRVYNDAGEPLESPQFFPWSTEGADEGDLVFAVGNPGSTSRLSTVSQLIYQRDFALPQQLAALRTRAAILEDYIDAHPVEAQEHDLENTLFSLSNSIKSMSGQLEGLRDPYLIARRSDAQEDFQEELAERDSLQNLYGDVFERIQALQQTREATSDQQAAFTGFGSPAISSHILIRAFYAYVYSVAAQRGVAPGQIENLRSEAVGVEPWPPELEEAYITARLRALREHLGERDPTVQEILGGRTPETVAERIVSGTALTDSAATATLLENGYLNSGDPTVRLIQAMAPLYLTMSRQMSDLRTREQAFASDLARARFAIYGERIPPDASFSLRLADGVVKGYQYNGTWAPWHTNYYGMYDHFYSYVERDAWDLPENWEDKPPALDLPVPLNLVSTNDITGGNSGSPLLSRDLELVGIVFDGNIEALPNQYLYRDVRARAISVDARGILEAVRDVYQAERIVLELTEHELVESDADVQ